MQKNKKDNYKNWLASVYLCESIVCSMITCFFPIKNISVILMGIIIIAIIVVNKTFNTRRMSRFVLGVAVIEFLLAMSGIINGFDVVSKYMLYFTVFGTTAAFIFWAGCDVIEMIRPITIIFTSYYIMYFLIIRRQFLNSGLDYYERSMGIAYNVAVSVYLMIGLIIYKKELSLSRKIYNLAVINGLIGIFIILFDCRSRGPIVAIVICTMAFLLFKLKGIKKMTLILILMTGSAAILLVNNFNFVLKYVVSFLDSKGIHIEALNKTDYLISSGIGIANGRDINYELAKKIFLKNPLLGGGVGYFETLSGGEYVHSYFYEILTDFGLVGIVIIISFFIFRPFYKTMRGRKGTENFSLVFVMSVGLLMLLFSSSLWLAPSYWFYFFFVLNIDIDIKERTVNSVKPGVSLGKIES